MASSYLPFSKYETPLSKYFFLRTCGSREQPVTSTSTTASKRPRIRPNFISNLPVKACHQSAKAKLRFYLLIIRQSIALCQEDDVETYTPISKILRNLIG